MVKVFLMLILQFCFLLRENWCGCGCNFTLPSDMKFGAGSSAFQTEGSSDVDGKIPSILDMISEQNDWDAGDASKSYELYHRDVEMAKEMGLQFYRFSVPWTRILPNGFSKEVNEVAVNHYNNLIDTLIANGVAPAVTILHFDIPQALYDLGGWNNPNFKDWFGDYARLLFILFGDRVKTWFTINEPLLFCYGVISFIKPKDELDVHLCPKNMLLGHAKAWRIYDEEFRKTQNGVIALINQIIWMEPASKDDEHLAELVRQYTFGIYYQPIYSKDGGWPKHLEALLSYDNATRLPSLSEEETKMIQGTYDFCAVNYYTSKLVRKPKPGEKIGEWPLYGSPSLGAVFYDSPDWLKTNEDWMTVYPEGLRKSLQWMNKTYGGQKFFITENGFPSNDSGLDDIDRIEFIAAHLEQLSLAVYEDGFEVLGYTAWSIVDDFEFNSRFKSDFGLYRVNFTDPMRERTPRKSAQFYKSVIYNVTNGLPVQCGNFSA